MDHTVTASERPDPRSARSAEALTRSVLHLAELQPANEISVTALVKLAGVSRKTFYNHATTPSELVTRALIAELDEARDTAEKQFGMASNDLVGAVRNRLRAILQHVYDRRKIYLSGAGGSLSPELYQLLSEHFRAAVRQSILDEHRVPPTLPGFDDDAHRESAIDIYASFVAGAYAGSMQAWLASPETDEVEFALDLILSALPPWMLSR
jgi:AcrR family transcriptional regulator